MVNTGRSVLIRKIECERAGPGNKGLSSVIGTCAIDPRAKANAYLGESWKKNNLDSKALQLPNLQGAARESHKGWKLATILRICPPSGQIVTFQVRRKSTGRWAKLRKLTSALKRRYFFIRNPMTWHTSNSSPKRRNPWRHIL